MFAHKTITIPQMNALFFDIKASSFDINIVPPVFKE